MELKARCVSGYYHMRMTLTSKQSIYGVQDEPRYLSLESGTQGSSRTWTRLKRKVLSHLGLFVVYLDYIWMFSHSMADHAKHLQQVVKYFVNTSRTLVETSVISVKALLTFWATRSRSVASTLMLTRPWSSLCGGTLVTSRTSSGT